MWNSNKDDFACRDGRCKLCLEKRNTERDVVTAQCCSKLWLDRLTNFIWSVACCAKKRERQTNSSSKNEKDARVSLINATKKDNQSTALLASSPFYFFPREPHFKISGFQISYDIFDVRKLCCRRCHLSFCFGKQGLKERKTKQTSQPEERGKEEKRKKRKETRRKPSWDE